MAAITPDDPVTLLYTSGTTGNPKGVLITHRSVLYEVAAGRHGGNIAGRRALGVLPAAGAHRRADVQPLPARSARRGHVHFCPDAKQLVGAVGQVQPTAFFGVPRVWEKIQAGIQALLAAEQDEARRAAVRPAMDTGRRYVESCQYGQQHAARAGRGVPRRRTSRCSAPIRALLGLGDAAIVSSAAAPLPPEVAAFFAGLGMKILDVYGMTETTGAFTIQHRGRVQARHGGPAGARHGGAHRRGRRDPHPRPAEHARAT